MKRVEDIESELIFTASRSSGPGGQNVNKVNSKVTLSFDVPNSQVLNEEEKEKILGRLGSKLTKEGVIMISASEKRSQIQNKELAITKLDKLLAKAFEKRKSRKATKVPASAKKARLEGKKKLGERKKLRKPPTF